MSISVSSNSIDSIINHQYSSSSPTSELGQLGLLFTPGFIDQLVNLLFNTTKQTTPPNALVTFDVSFGWIDKVPLAKFLNSEYDHNGNKITEKVEIGDMHFVYNDNLITNGSGKSSCVSGSYGLILQAKRAPSLDIPSVPVTKSNAINSSTAKEFHLLSKWPLFDLYKTSKNKNSILNGININNNQANILSYGWYAACPPTNKITTNWSCRWMCSEAKINSSCDLSLGSVLAAFYNRTILRTFNVGVGFDFIVGWENFVNKNAVPHWSALNNQIISICNELKLPSVANVKAKRLIKMSIIRNDIFSKLRLLYSRNPQLLQAILKRILDERYIEDSELRELFLFLDDQGLENKDILEFVGRMFNHGEVSRILPHLRGSRNKGDDLSFDEIQNIFRMNIINFGRNVKSATKGIYVLNISRTIQITDGEPNRL
ncbi:hypothetical protein N1689_06885 [Pantoea sp. XY16]|uniref:hypothetical protein n=1 Tax=Pantoea sp. XY16 TaxID=2976705 RepID=UPI0021A96631|nr:hypothetical protein [Pantoea sp. XY16]MCT2417570.1 hypothetical protein [Pantoea sp. XY16]